MKRAPQIKTKSKKKERREKKATKEPKVEKVKEIEKKEDEFNLDMTEEEWDQKYAETLAKRGRKGMDNRSLVQRLRRLAFISRKFNPRKEVKVLLNLIPTMIESRKSDDGLDERVWKQSAVYLRRLMYLLEKGQFVLVDAALDQRFTFNVSSTNLGRSNSTTSGTDEVTN